MQRIVFKWLNENPEKHHWAMSQAILSALREAFHCK
jgi:hypothetical protein